MNNDILLSNDYYLCHIDGAYHLFNDSLEIPNQKCSDGVSLPGIAFSFVYGDEGSLIDNMKDRLNYIENDFLSKPIHDSEIFHIKKALDL